MQRGLTLETILFLAGLHVRFLTEMEWKIAPSLNHFVVSTAEDADVTVRVSRNWDCIALPGSPPLGEDAISRYYRQGETLYCVIRGSAKGPIACAVYDGDCRKILCVLNDEPFLRPPKDFGSILRMIPIRAVFQRFGVLFLHASRIAYQGKAILFSAPSGTGKTTQAKLWQKYRGADILCNDRTLVRKADNAWYTYGYPLDGSQPVGSNRVSPLGAIVLLEQGKENRLERLKLACSAALLIRQTVIDTWNPEAKVTAMRDILSLLEDIPVYLLTCTPDERAVETLEAKLLEDGVI